jgi:hypothetical protein
MAAFLRRARHGKKRVKITKCAKGSKSNAHEDVHPLHQIGVVASVFL